MEEFLEHNELGRERRRRRLAEESARLGFWEAHCQPGTASASPPPFAPRPTLYSPGFRALLGEEALETSDGGEWLREALHPEDRERFERALTKAVADGTAKWRGEVRLRHRAGHFVRQEARVELEREADGSVTLFGLHREAPPDHAADRDELGRELEQFCYVVSHDLQEPLRMVSSYLQLLARRYRSALDGEGQQFIQFAVGGAKKMSQQLRDLLAYSRLGRPTSALVPVATSELVAQVVESLSIFIDESGARIETENLPAVSGDASQLTLLFKNLLHNALKFRSPEPPRISIRAERRDDQWLFQVRDNGIGIDPKFHQRVFLMFQRGRENDPNGPPPEGTGAGLALAKRVVENHHGKIWLESRLGEGSTFFFTLPADLEIPN